MIDGLNGPNLDLSLKSIYVYPRSHIAKIHLRLHINAVAPQYISLVIVTYINLAATHARRGRDVVA